MFIAGTRRGEFGDLVTRANTCAITRGARIPSRAGSLYGQAANRLGRQHCATVRTPDTRAAPGALTAASGAFYDRSVRTLRRDCGHLPLSDAGACPACGSARILRHAELHDLAIAHLDCDAFYAAIQKRNRPPLRACTSISDASCHPTARRRKAIMIRPRTRAAGQGTFPESSFRSTNRLATVDGRRARTRRASC